jgi:ATP-dependent DNA helicase RecQ
VQEGFIRGETAVMVTTSAFSMGVDKENVKMVVHYDISDSLENYMQEAGRAWRKADLQARCHLLFDENDLNDHFAMLGRTKLTKKR